MKPAFISNYKGASDFHVAGVRGRVTVRWLTPTAQAFYGAFDPQTIGTVVNGLEPVSDPVLNHFQSGLESDPVVGSDQQPLTVSRLVTAKWYRFGWVRCEA